MRVSFSTPRSHVNSQKKGSAITFGYDKKLSEEFNKKMTDINRPDLVEVNNLANSIEDSFEKLKSEDITYDDIRTLKKAGPFASLKVIIESSAKKLAPELNYVERETASYLKEAHDVFTSKPKDESLSKADTFIIRLKTGIANLAIDKFGLNPRKIVDSLGPEYSDISVYDSVKDAIDPPKQPSAPENSGSIVPLPSKNEQTLPVKQDSSMSNIEYKHPLIKADALVEQFIPNQYSPKGFDDVGGMAEAKEKFQDLVIDTMINPIASKKRKDYFYKEPKGVLLDGPPGCGKTYIVEALAQEVDLPMFKLKGSNIGSEFIHKTSVNIKTAFNEVSDYAVINNTKCIFFIDEIDAIGGSRDGFGVQDNKVDEVNTLLQELDALDPKNVIVVAATNRLDAVDGAIKRSGRFSEKLTIGLPDVETRQDVITKDLLRRNKGKHLAENKKAVEKLAEKAEGFSNADLVAIIDKAAMKAYKEGVDIGVRHVKKAIDESENMKMTKQQLSQYQTDVVKTKKKRQIGFIPHEEKAA